MGGSPGGGDNDLYAATFGGRNEFSRRLRRPVGGQHSAFVGDLELRQRLRCVLHCLPVGFAAHDYDDQRLGRFGFCLIHIML